MKLPAGPRTLVSTSSFLALLALWCTPIRARCSTIISTWRPFTPRGTSIAGPTPLLIMRRPRASFPYDLFIIDEASQIEDDVAVRLHNGFRELPQRPTIFFAADFQQLNPIGSSAAMRLWITVMTTISLYTIHRTNDNRLLSFLRQVRVKQPPKAVIQAFFDGCTWDSITLEQAVHKGMAIGALLGEPFHWLTVTNKGSEAVNSACLSACRLDKPENISPYCGDYKVLCIPNGVAADGTGIALLAYASAMLFGFFEVFL